MPKKKVDYSTIYTLRKDGRYQKVVKGKTLIDKDPLKLAQKIKDYEYALEHPSPVTFEAVADGWSAVHFGRVSFKTAEAYTAPLRRIKEHFTGDAFASVTAMQIQAYISDLPRKGYSRRTVQMHLDILRMIYNYAILQGVAKSNPVLAVKLPDGLIAEKRTLPGDLDIQKVKDNLSKPFGLFAFFALYTGMRRGELLALRYEDIDFDAMQITVNKSVSYQGNKAVLKATKTDAGTRRIILLDVLADKLDKGAKGLIFSDKGKLLSKTQFRHRWDNYQKSAGFTITPHQLRHAYATICYDAGIDEKAAQSLLGHSSITVTKNVYTHIRQSRMEATAKALNQFTSAQSGKPSVTQPETIDYSI